MATLQIQNIEPALKQLVRDGLAQQFEQEDTVYNAVSKGAKREFVNGKGWRIPSYLRPPVGITYGPEALSFNLPGNPKMDDMFVYPTAVALAGEISGRTIRNIKDASSLIDGMTDLMTRYSKALTKDLEIGMFGDGTALRATAKSATGSGNAVVVTFYSATVDAAGSTFGKTKGAIHLEVGATYDVWDSTMTTNRGTFNVLSKTDTTATGTLSFASGSVADSDIFTHANGGNKAPRGLAALINNSGLLQLLDRATYYQLKSPVIDLAGNAITVAQISKIKRLLKGRNGVNGAKMLTAILPLAQEDALERLGHGLKRATMGDRKFDGSYDEIGHGDTAFVPAIDCCEDRVYFTDLKDLSKYVEMDFGVYDLDGNTLRMKSGAAGVGSDAYTFALGIQFNLGIGSPKSHALIKRCAIGDNATQQGSYS